MKGKTTTNTYKLAFFPRLPGMGMTSLIIFAEMSDDFDQLSREG